MTISWLKLSTLILVLIFSTATQAKREPSKMSFEQAQKAMAAAEAYAKEKNWKVAILITDLAYEMPSIQTQPKASMEQKLVHVAEGSAFQGTFEFCPIAFTSPLPIACLSSSISPLFPFPEMERHGERGE